MSDIVVKTGSETSEYKLAKGVDVAGSVVLGVGAVLTALAEAGFGSGWIGVAIAATGAVMKVVNALGYGKQRAEVKAIAIESAERQGIVAMETVAGLDEAKAQIDDLLVAADLKKVR